MTTLSATIPGLLRCGCSVVGHGDAGVVLRVVGDRAYVSWDEELPAWYGPINALDLDLRDPLTQSAVWLWLERHDGAQAAIAEYDGDPRTPEGLRAVVLSLVEEP